MKTSLKSLKILVLLGMLGVILPNSADADTIWLNKAGQIAMGWNGKAKHGVIRGYNEKIFEWQPYYKGWRKPPVLPRIQWNHVEKIVHSLDTNIDILRLVRSVKETLADKGKATYKGIELYPRLDPNFIVHSIVENKARFDLTKEEADKDISNYGFKNLKVLLKYWGNPYGVKSIKEQRIALEYQQLGAQARRSVIGILNGAKNLMTETRPSSFAEGTLDPRYTAITALELVPNLTWALDLKEHDSRGQHEEMARTLLDIYAATPRIVRDQKFQAAALEQAKQLIKNSERARRFVTNEFVRPSDIKRKGAAALLLLECGKTKAKIISTATQFLLEQIRSQPSRDGRVNHSTRILIYLMANHPAAMHETQKCIRELVASGAGSSKKTVLEDEIFLQILKRCEANAKSTKGSGSADSDGISGRAGSSKSEDQSTPDE